MDIYVINISCKPMYTCKIMKEYKFEEVQVVLVLFIFMFPQSNITTTNTVNKYWPIILDDPPESLDAETYLSDQS